MDIKPQTTRQQRRDQRYLQLLVDYLSQHSGEVFEEAEISREIKEATNEKIPKARIRGLLKDHPSIDQEVLNYGKPDGKIQWLPNL